ncbi:hypothetical protein C0993_005749 [Termitomyces sp. T159_Od127]|nr:hypothetical protein C0993_005749 [Termitomyces sp. T159_Od127]
MQSPISTPAPAKTTPVTAQPQAESMRMCALRRWLLRMSLYKSLGVNVMDPLRGFVEEVRARCGRDLAA